MIKKSQYSVKRKIIYLILLISFISSTVISGPISAYSACVACCGAIHSADWFMLGYGAVATGLCIVEACINPVPSPCIDPRDNTCTLVFQGAFFLPTP